jgi:hypothetical protein
MISGLPVTRYSGKSCIGVRNSSRNAAALVIYLRRSNRRHRSLLASRQVVLKPENGRFLGLTLGTRFS